MLAKEFHTDAKLANDQW